LSRGSSWFSRVSLILLDLDQFKPINDNHGHEVGDLLLIEVARRIQQCLADGDLGARIGGDEFGVILEQLGSDRELASRQADHVAGRIVSALAAGFDVGGIALHCSASHGIRLFPCRGDGATRLLRDADTAMYRQKKGSGGNT
jgi:diguanylate cyclase (GGDEF)-like protein